ncbi:MAG: type I-U CRISPR-associated protein Cas5/Cas6 [Xanthomonadales bacterium]|nr:type I-U CRISPR-associated protein Cas5/Cas6 [Xanthomonadales bacterium]
MLALAFTFPAGRYHATPWDRHVNEGAVAWPPEPWRILRGLIATWHHKVKHFGKHDEKTLLTLVEALSGELPQYRLPPASHSHTRHYMPQFAAGKTSLVFDAFAAIGRQDSLTVIWQNIDLPDPQRALLDDLLSAMGYLGRAESWVEAKRVSEAPKPDCRPGEAAVDISTGEFLGELVTLHAPLPEDEYQSLRAEFLADAKARKKLGSTLPDNLLAALSVDTADLRKVGWSQPPAARKVSYLRPPHALHPRRAAPPAKVRKVVAVNFVLDGKPLPRVEDSLRMGELMRIATMSQCKRIFGEAHVPSVFSGHRLPAENRHGHAFYLPWDSDGDGKLDRVLVYVAGGMSDSEQQALLRVQKLWNQEGVEWRLVFEGSGTPAVAERITMKNRTWRSVTPYLHPWHVKKRFSIEDQIRRECRERGLPEPLAVQPLEQIDVGRNRKRRPIHFHRFRSRRGLSQPDRLGSFWCLTFPEPVDGPLALGFACHFGLGLFAPESSA